MASDEPVSPVTREKLYEEVWATPVHALAPKYGMSGRGLGKLCVRDAIPVPPRGYWAKVRAGHRVRRTPLPPAPKGRAPDQPALIPRKPVVTEEAASASMFSPELGALLDRVLAGPTPVVRDDVRGQHPAVRQAGQWATETIGRPRAFWEPRGGWSRPQTAPGLSPDTRRPALQLLDALVRQAESYGIVVSATWHRGVAFSAAVQGISFTLSVHAPLSRTKLPADERDKAHRDHVYRHTERLQVGIVTSYWTDRTWTARFDALKERIGEVLPDALRVVDRKLRERAESERREREYQAEQRRLADAEARRRRRAARQTKLLAESSRWREVVIAREYVAAVERELLSRGAAVALDSKAGRWIAWARSALDRMDPTLARTRRHGTGSAEPSVA